MRHTFERAAADLARARRLLDIDRQAAGAVCGVGLERALMAAAASLAGSCALLSLGQLGWLLRDAGRVTPEQHHTIRYVALLRSRCVHARRLPSAAQVERMIAYSYQVAAALADGDG